jgi:hypothetical protein
MLYQAIVSQSPIRHVVPAEQHASSWRFLLSRYRFDQGQLGTADDCVHDQPPEQLTASGDTSHPAPRRPLDLKWPTTGELWGTYVPSLVYAAHFMSASTTDTLPGRETMQHDLRSPQ